MDIASLTILEEAPWPSFLLDQTGLIILTNKSARTWLGIGPLARPKLQSLVSAPPENENVEVLLSQMEAAGSQRLTRTLRVRSGPFQSYALAFTPLKVDGEYYRLLQLFPVPEEPKTPKLEPPKPEVPQPEPQKPEASKAAPINSEAAPAPVDSSVFLKQKLDCALQLTRTVSLDFNNALTSILGHTSHLLSQTEATHPWRPSLLAVEKSAERAAEIAHDLAAFSRQEKDPHTHVAGNVNTMLRQTVEIVQKSAPQGVQWRLDWKKQILAATYDEAKIQQAIVKVLDNALQAVGESGTISVKTSNVQLETDEAGKPFGIHKGSYVLIEIIDDGPGIPQDLLPRVFEPFFTTKPNPPHRGLGLTWVYGIVTNHGGRVVIQNAKGRGCCVSIFLPALQTTVKEIRGLDKDLTGSGTHTILMVDDEEMLLTMGETILSAYGYSVVTASNGEDALRLFKQSPESIDLVITDIVMPNMSGRELIEKLRVIAPNLKIICSSGYMPSAYKRSGLGEKNENENFLQKPFTSQDLLRKVKQTLAGSA